MKKLGYRRGKHFTWDQAANKQAAELNTRIHAPGPQPGRPHHSSAQSPFEEEDP